ncbi:MAG: phosphoribosylaminoimidazolesuccinocarboxamide synthase, partial [Patescibacteria group bacterium]
MLVEGKTKIIFPHPLEDEKVLIRSKQAITAGDGLRKDILEGKDIFATSTA